MAKKPKAAKNAGQRKPSVLMIASEALPFSKTGGLADVLGALPPALARLGWDVSVATPRYRGVSAGTVADRFPVSVGGYTREVTFYEAPMGDGARALLLDCPELFDRDQLYAVNNVDYPDNPRRFAMLVRGALEFTGRRSGVSILHAHDWQAGLAPVYLKTLYGSHPVLRATPSVFTIHNIAYQGNFDADWLPRLDLPWTLFAIDGLEYWGRVSFLKGGVTTSDAVTTVSRTYAREIQTPEQGYGFDGIMRSRRDALTGILNGIDTVQWDAARDRFLPVPFDALSVGDGKRAAKRVVLERYGMAATDVALERPLIGMISRMVDQKGLDLIASVGDALPTLGAIFVVLGTGEERYQNFWTTLAGRFTDNIGVRIGFDEPLAHLIEAGADMFLMPSRYEPCGLNQMYSLRYGTVPIVRRVGGLADTVKDCSARASSCTGFAFAEYSGAALLGAIRRAIGQFADRPRWRAIQAAGMAQDNSWDRSAREYVKIYERVLGRGGTKNEGPGARGQGLGTSD